MKKFLKKKVLFSIIAALTFVVSIMAFFVNSPNVYAADLKTVVLKSTDFTGEGEGSDNPWTLSNSSWAISNLAFYNYWNKDVISKTEAGQGSAFSSSITYNNPSKYAIVSVKVYGAGQNHSNTVDVSVTCGSETTATQTVTKDGTNLAFDLSTNPTSSVVINFQHPAHTETATIELSSTQEEKGQMTFIEITAKEVSEVSIAKGDGVKSVYLSTNQNATSGSVSGTKFVKGTTVYGFAELAKGYKAKSGWTKVSGTADTEGAKYRVSSVSAGSNNFGSISADLITYNITYNLVGGTHGTTHPATYNITTNTFTISNPTRTGYTFKGWSGTGLTGDSNKNVSVAKGSTGDRSYTANWTANTYTVTFNKQNGTGGSNSVTATYDLVMPSATMPTKTGYTFAGYYDNTSGGTQYYTATGETAKNWDKAEATILYARWTFNPDELIGLINDIGDVNYPNSRESLFKAEEVYNGLEATDQTTFQTTYSNDYKTLTDARIEYDAQKNVKVQEVIDAINAIGEVKYPNTTVKEALLNAEELYDGLATEEKNSTTIPNYSTLTDARESYNTQRTSKVNEVIVAIDAISEPFDENRETQITNARTLFNALDLDEQNDTWVTNLADLTNAEAADIVADMIEALTPADTQEYRDAVSAARTAYTNLTEAQKSYISVSILQELVDNETAITVMDKINDIGNVQYTNASKALIYDANQAYEALTDSQKELVVNYSTLTQANTDYDKVDESVEKVNLIKYDSNGDLIFDDENKTLIYDAKETYDLLTDYQKEIYPEDILQKLLDALAVYNTLDKIDKIGDVSYTDGYINQVTDATNAYNDLTDSQKELISELALKDLNDNETVLDTLKQIHDIDKSTTPSEYKEKLDDAKTVYENLTDDQKTLIGDNIKDLNDREKTNEVSQNIDSIKDENSLEYSDSNKKTITDARKSYENLTDDQKKILPSKVLKILTDDETIIAVLDKIYEIGKVSYNTESEDKIAEAREAYELLAEDQKKLVDTKDYSVLTTKEEKFDSITKTAIGWGVYLIILSSVALCTGIFFIIFLLRKKDEDDENNNIQKPKTQKASATVLPLVILSSYFARGPYLAFYIIISLAVAVWIAVLVIYILKKKKDSPVMEASIGTEAETTVDDTNDLEEDVTGEADNMMSDENAEASIEIDTVTKKHEG